MEISNSLEILSGDLQFFGDQNWRHNLGWGQKIVPTQTCLSNFSLQKIGVLQNIGDLQLYLQFWRFF